MPTIRIPPVLRPDAGGRREVVVDAATVGEALRRLVDEYPSLEERILPNGHMAPFLNLFVDGDDIRLRQGLDTRIGPESALLLLPAVAGGSPAVAARGRPVGI